MSGEQASVPASGLAQYLAGQAGPGS
jgi:hypothetical protein